MYSIVFSKQAVKDLENIRQSPLNSKARKIVALLAENPFQNPPPYEKLLGKLLGLYSRRLNVQHRLVYEVIEEKKTVKIVSMWTHYEL